jgi:hypothetical protein
VPVHALNFFIFIFQPVKSPEVAAAATPKAAKSKPAAVAAADSAAGGESPAPEVRAEKTNHRLLTTPQVCLPGHREIYEQM